jgi:hypothetical protein
MTGVYPKCDSKDIESMDTCLINKPIINAIIQLGIDSSQFFLFDEPPGILRGIYIFGIDSVKIRLYTERVSIMDSLGLVNYDTSKYILNDKKIVGVSWKKEATQKERKVGLRISYWGF